MATTRSKRKREVLQHDAEKAWEDDQLLQQQHQPRLSVTRLIQDCELFGPARPLTWRWAKEVLLARHVVALQEYELPVHQLHHYDKVFAALWLNDNTVAVGTKCNNFLTVNISSKKVHRIALPRINIPREARESLRPDNCGIHTICVNPSRSLLATGGAEAHDCQIFSLPDLKPTVTLRSHRDWIFGAAWVDDCALVTGSRDATLKLWKLPGNDGRVLDSPISTNSEHEGKVRDVKFDATVKQLASLGCVDATVRVWDPQLQHVRTVWFLQSRH